MKTKKGGNPFERLGNRRVHHHPAFNDRVKGSVRDVAKSRAKSDAKRKAGLLKDLTRERRENEFLDKRIGEDLEDDDVKFLLRFQRAATQRSKKRKKEDDVELTHGGVPLDEVKEDEVEEDRDVAQLDDEFTVLAPLLKKRGRTKFEKADDYDVALRELELEKKARPAEPAWSREEAARRAFEKLTDLQRRDPQGFYVIDECPRSAADLTRVLKVSGLSTNDTFQRLRDNFTPKRASSQGMDFFSDLANALVEWLLQETATEKLNDASDMLRTMSLDAPRVVAQALLNGLDILARDWIDKGSLTSIIGGTTLLRVVPRLPDAVRDVLTVRAQLLAARLLDRSNDPNVGCLATIAALDLCDGVWMPELLAFLERVDTKQGPVARLLEALPDLVPKGVTENDDPCVEEVQTTAIASVEPKLEHRLVQRRDAHLDGPAADIKRVKRQLQREHRGAMRELRRDTAFLRKERRQARQTIADERKDDRQKNFNWIRTQAQRGWQ